MWIPFIDKGKKGKYIGFRVGKYQLYLTTDFSSKLNCEYVDISYDTETKVIKLIPNGNMYKLVKNKGNQRIINAFISSVMPMGKYIFIEELEGFVCKLLA